ncbi:YezD family protein [Rossellomorea sp. GAMAL-10_SWC]
MSQTNDLTPILEVVESLLNGLRFGTITLVVQDGRIIQVEKQEKIRLK